MKGQASGAMCSSLWACGFLKADLDLPGTTSIPSLPAPCPTFLVVEGEGGTKLRLERWRELSASSQ